MRRVRVLAWAVPVLLAAGCGLWSAPPGPPAKPGAKLPVGLIEARYDVIEAALQENKGSVVLIDFWALTCPPCVAGFPHLVELHKKFESKFASNPAYIEMYRSGNAYHPAHPFFMWYWGEAGRQWVGRTIVVGADNEYIPKLMGWETAPNMAEALRMASDTAPKSPDILALHCPPIFMADVTVPEHTKKQLPEGVPGGGVGTTSSVTINA